MKYQDEAQNVIAKSKLIKVQCSNFFNFVSVSFYGRPSLHYILQKYNCKGWDSVAIGGEFAAFNNHAYFSFILYFQLDLQSTFKEMFTIEIFCFLVCTNIFTLWLMEIAPWCWDPSRVSSTTKQQFPWFSNFFPFYSKLAWKLGTSWA